MAGFAITRFIGHVGWDVTGEILRHLMDSVDPGVIANAERAVSAVPGIEHAHARARWMGRTLLVEVEGFVAASTTVEAADAIGGDLEAAVFAAFPKLGP